MKAKTKFKKMYYLLPEQARTELVYSFKKNHMILEVCWLEIKNNTKLGKNILRQLGYQDD